MPEVLFSRATEDCIGFAKLVDMKDVEARELVEPERVDVETVDVGSADAQRAIGHYFAELNRRFVNGFAAVDGGADNDRELMRPPHGVFLVLRTDTGDVVGCGGLQRVDERIAEIKRMWVSERVRGQGLGRRVLTELEHRAAQLGYRTVVLDTNGVLTEARALYAASGYTEIARYNDNPYAEHWFEKPLVAR